jgi:hypothetical protein
LYQDTSKILNDSVIIKTEVATLKNLKVTTVLHRKANVSVDCFAPKGDVVPVIITFTDLTTLLIANKPIDTTVTGLETIYVSCDNIYPGHDYEAKVEALYKVNDVIVNDTTVTKNFMISNDTLTVSVVPKLPIGRTGFPSFKVTVPNGDVLANCTVTVQDSATGQVIGNPYVHTNLSGTMTIVDTCKGLNPGTYIYQFDGTYFGNPVSRSGYFTINTGKIKFTNFILKSVSQENASIVFKVQIPNAETGIINLVLKDSIGNSVSNEDIQVSNTAVITRNFNNLIPDSKYKISVSGDYFTVPSGLDTSFVTPFYKVTYDVSSQALNGTVTVAGSYSAIKSVDLQVAYFLAIDTDFISPIEPRFITGQVGNINEVFENIPDGGYRVLISGTCNGYPVNSWKSLPFHFGSIKPITINSISSAVVNSSTININSKVTVPNSQSGTCYFMVATDSFFISTVIDSISVVGMQNISTSFTKMDTGTYWVKLRTKTYDVIVDSKVMIVTVLPIQLTLIQDVVGTSKDIAVVNFKFSAPDTLDVITGYYTTDDSNFLFPLATQTIRGNMGVESIRFDSIPNGSYIMRIIGLYNGYYTNSKTYPFIISVTAIQIISAEEDVRIYPNPATDFIVLSTTGEYAIINMAGQMVKMGLNNSEQINVSELKNGTYILKMNNGKFAKFIKR